MIYHIKLLLTASLYFVGNIEIYKMGKQVKFIINKKKIKKISTKIF